MRIRLIVVRHLRGLVVVLGFVFVFGVEDSDFAFGVRIVGLGFYRYARIAFIRDRRVLSLASLYANYGFPRIRSVAVFLSTDDARKMENPLGANLMFVDYGGLDRGVRFVLAEFRNIYRINDGFVYVLDYDLLRAHASCLFRQGFH